jgi:hypothetical protein
MKLTLALVGLSMIVSMNAFAGTPAYARDSYFSKLVNRSQDQDSATTPQCAVCCSWLKKSDVTTLSCIPTC